MFLIIENVLLTIDDIRPTKKVKAKQSKKPSQIDLFRLGNMANQGLAEFDPRRHLKTAQPR